MINSSAFWLIKQSTWEQKSKQKEKYLPLWKLPVHNRDFFIRLTRNVQIYNFGEVRYNWTARSAVKVKTENEKFTRCLPK